MIQAMPQPRHRRSLRTGRIRMQDQRESPFFVPPQLRPRVVLRFASDEKNLLISGMLAGGNELANRPAIVDVPVGRGHVVMFATNPMWRHQTQGEFFLLFNAALNYDNLNVGRPSRRGQGNDRARGRRSVVHSLRHAEITQIHFSSVSWVDEFFAIETSGIETRVGVADREAGDHARVLSAHAQRPDARLQPEEQPQSGHVVF